jgi:tetratricopeptide (TPR) repeat protein
MSRRKRQSRRTTPEPQLEAATPSGPRSRQVAALGLIAVVTVVAYLPALQGQFIWDDNAHVTRPELRSLEGLYRIWFDLGATQQYYPLLHSAFWAEHKLWGNATLGYHVTSLLLHITAACLVYVILQRLKIPGALLAAAIFALHPVHVESVAWISEQKNTLSAVFYLSALLVYLRFDDSRKRSLYLVALGLFVLGLLSKTVTATLPAALLVIFWWRRGTLSWRRDVQPLMPFFLLGAVAGLLTAWVERNLIGAAGADFELTFLQRGLLAGRVIWFYVGKLVWPANLTFIYPRWDVSPYVWWQWLLPIAALAVLVSLWAIRGRWRAPLAGWLLFVGTLFPVLGFLNVFPFIYSFVADHFQYLASLGVIVLAASGIALGLERLPPRARWAGNAICLVLVGTLAALTWRQSWSYTNVVALYQTTIDRNPTCWMAHYNLGNLLAHADQTEQAIKHYRRTIELNPNYARAHNNLGIQLARLGQTQQAIECYQKAVQVEPGFATAHYNLGNMLRDLGQTQQAIGHYQEGLRFEPDSAKLLTHLGVLLAQIGQTQQAIGYCQQALRVKPDDALVHFTLGNALKETGQTEEAIEHYQQAVRIQPDYAAAYCNLGILQARAGRPQAAIAEFQRALQITPDMWEAHNNLASVFRQTGQLQEAVEHYQQALRLNPDNFDLYSQLARFHAQMNQSAEAIAVTQQALNRARSKGQTALADKIEAWLTKYQAGLAEGDDAPPTSNDEPPSP